jgi:hypothetical protein
VMGNSVLNTLITYLDLLSNKQMLVAPRRIPSLKLKMPIIPAPMITWSYT